MNDLNVTTLMGRLTRNPELYKGKSGVSFAVFTVAVNRHWKDQGKQKEESAFVPCLVFGPAAEFSANHRKGESVMVNGRLRTESWESDGQTHTRLVLVVADLRFVKPVFGTEEPQTATVTAAPTSMQDEIPF